MRFLLAKYFAELAYETDIDPYIKKLKRRSKKDIMYLFKKNIDAILSGKIDRNYINYLSKMVQTV